MEEREKETRRRMMQDVYESGSLGPVRLLTPGQELAEILAAVDQDRIAAVRVGRVIKGRLKVRATVTPGKRAPRGSRAQRKRLLKLAKAMRRRNRRRIVQRMRRWWRSGGR